MKYDTRHGGPYDRGGADSYYYGMPMGMGMPLDGPMYNNYNYGSGGAGSYYYGMPMEMGMPTMGGARINNYGGGRAGRFIKRRGTCEDSFVDALAQVNQYKNDWGYGVSSKVIIFNDTPNELILSDLDQFSGRFEIFPPKKVCNILYHNT